MKYCTDEKTQIIKISGSKGIGKTRFVQELGDRVYQRKLFANGVYYLDFNNVSSPNQINELFKNEGIEFLLPSRK